MALYLPNTRNDAIDLLRSFGILAMIAGHVSFGETFAHFIASFHMPLFFFVSGLFFTDNKSLGKFTTNKAQKILIPYLSFGIFYYIVWLCIDSSHSAAYPLKYLFWDNSVGAGNGMPYVGALWFLTAFFIANIVYYGISHIKSLSLQLVAVLLTVMLGTLFPLILPFRLPYTLDSGLVGVGFIYCGHKFKNSVHYDKLSHLSTCALSLISILILLSIFLNGHVNMRRGVYCNVILFWVNALCCILVGINLCNRIIKPKLHMVSCFISWLAIMGRDSLIFLCVNEFIIIGLRRVLPLQNKILSHSVILILTILMCYEINYFIQHTKLRCFIGKF